MGKEQHKEEQPDGKVEFSHLVISIPRELLEAIEEMCGKNSVSIELLLKNLLRLAFLTQEGCKLIIFDDSQENISLVNLFGEE